MLLGKTWGRNSAIQFLQHAANAPLDCCTCNRKIEARVSSACGRHPSGSARIDGDEKDGEMTKKMDEMLKVKMMSW